MNRVYKIFFIIAVLNFASSAQANKKINFKNIAIQADKVTINEAMNQLSFEDNIEIKFDRYVISGDAALLSYQDEKLEITGMPASISSNMVNGTANLFIIHPNQSMEMIGNAKLNNKGNKVTSNLITYQIGTEE
ncbi:MAG: LptA/OstA family protein [SAR86 cluster bacterium]|jgi:lipopolysaccharide transport protein LptA|nr:LptA/OstA family protein [SAR86 cluster bacterium]